MEYENRPYIGVTGFTNKEQITKALDCLPFYTDRRLMVGVVATYKSLRGIPMKQLWQEQTPNPESIEGLFLPDERVFNLVHYSTEEGQEESILEDMLMIHDLTELTNPNFHGFQLNIPWPSLQTLESYREAAGYTPKIVLQIGTQAVEMADGTPLGVTRKLHDYVGDIDYILFDLSGGRGLPIDPERARRFLGTIADKGWNLGLGVAGGLSYETLDIIQPLLEKFPNLSFDAQGKLRNESNELDMKKVRKYLQKAAQLTTPNKV